MKQDAPAKAAALRIETIEARKLEPGDKLDVTDTTSLEILEQRLLKKQADLAALEANLQRTREAIKYEANRPQIIREELIEAKKQLSGISDNLSPPLATGSNQPLEEAEYTLRETQARMLTARISTLNQELLSQPERVELLHAEEEKAEHSVKFVKGRAELLEQFLGQRRQIQARATESKAESAKALAEGKHPLVEQLANRNAELSAEISEFTRELDQIENEEDRVSAEGNRIGDDFKSARQKLEVAGLSQILGQILQKQRRILPDTRSYKLKASEVEKHIAEISLRQIRHYDEIKSLRNIDQYIEDYTSELSEEESQQINSELRQLANDRKQFLNQAYKTENTYLRALSQLDDAHRNLSEVTEQYDTFLSERLLWIRSTNPVNLSSVAILPRQIQELLAPKHWQDILTTLYKQTTNKPWMIFTLLIVGMLLWKERGLRRSLIATGDNVGNVIRDSITYTAWGLVLTLVLSIAWPLLMVSIGWQLGSSPESSSFTKTFGAGLIQTAGALFILRAYRILCLKGGVADRHFKWPQTGLKLLRRDFDIFIYSFLPAGFIAYIVIFSDIPGHDEGLGRLAFVIAALALTAFFYRMLNPNTGALREFALPQNRPTMTGMRYLWLVLAVVIPVGATVLALLGYLYSAGTLLENLIQSLWLILELILLHQFVVRWLLIARRRLALQAARAEREAMLAAREDSTVAVSEDALDLDEPSIDIDAISVDIRKLLNTSLVILAIFSLWASWSDILPALRIFNEITLWQHKAEVGGEIVLSSITLADAGKTIIAITLLLVILKRLPALIEILLRQRSRITPGSLYAIKSLTSYAIIAVGISIIFSTLGGTWSEIQWIFAALGVGIGFGLQEIVANFISGLIILFERPIRVGDTVTVGDISGTVTRIRIRATTIRDFDRKELLVPNKEFITNRLLNWSLSDNVTRLSVTVGIAYGSDVKLATQLMEEAAKESEYTLDEPESFVAFDSFGDNSLNMVLRFFIDNLDYRVISKSELHKAINEKFTKAGISIAFPQRDVHLDTAHPLDVRIHREKT
jgi:potassium efflux system protein